MNCRVWITLTLLIGQTCLAWGVDHPILRHMIKQDTLASTRLTLDCTSAPRYQLTTSGQRVDLLLNSASVAPSLRLLPEDDKIVKVLLAKRQEELLVSFLLRQIPDRVTVSRARNATALHIDIFWPRNDSARPAIAFRISGMPTPKDSGTTASITNTSRFSRQWETFFRDYMSWPVLDIAPKLSRPPLPTLPGKTSATAAGQRLQQAEALIAKDKAAEAATLLEADMADSLPAELQARFFYLKSLALADSGAPFRAQAMLAMAEKTLAADKALRPFALLLTAELALAGKRPEQAMRHLTRKDITWPRPLRSLRNLRRADAAAAAGQTTAAYRAYKRLGKLPKALAGQPYSLYHAARACIENKAHASAEQLFRQLAACSPNQDMASEALVAAAQTVWLAKGQAHAEPLLREVGNDFPDQQGALRARLKRIDGEMIAGRQQQHLKQSRQYGQIAEQAKSRALREEATFKQALSVVMSGRHEQAIGMLERFARNFAAGPLRGEAQALLADILPGFIDRLIAEKRDLEAVAMVEHHRELLLNSPWDKTFLPHLAEAMTRLGLHRRAVRIYLYLLDSTRAAAHTEPYFLPLLELLLKQQEDAAVEKHARRYLSRFPKGADRAAVYLVRLKALQHRGQTDRIAALLQAADRPASPELQLFGARFFWQQGDYAHTARFAGQLNKTEAGSAESRLLEAEALRLSGRLKQALPLYQALSRGERFADQARFQQANILLQLGRRSEAINLLSQLAEKGKDVRWQQLARETLAVRRIL